MTSGSPLSRATAINGIGIPAIEIEPLITAVVIGAGLFIIVSVVTSPAFL